MNCARDIFFRLLIHLHTTQTWSAIIFYGEHFLLPQGYLSIPKQQRKIQNFDRGEGPSVGPFQSISNFQNLSKGKSELRVDISSLGRKPTTTIHFWLFSTANFRNEWQGKTYLLLKRGSRSFSLNLNMWVKCPTASTAQRVCMNGSIGAVITRIVTKVNITSNKRN